MAGIAEVCTWFPTPLGVIEFSLNGRKIQESEESLGFFTISKSDRKSDRISARPKIPEK